MDITTVPDWYEGDRIDDAVAGARRYIHDMNLDPSSAGKYRPGLVIREPRAFEATPERTGMDGSHRFAVLSNHMYDISDLASSGGLWMNHSSLSGSLYKVLDVYEAQGFVQILLLHIFDDERAPLWQAGTTEVEAGLVERVRRAFVEELALKGEGSRGRQRWIQESPSTPGFDAEGHAYAPYSPLEDRLRVLDEADFRAVDRRLVYIEEATTFLMGYSAPWMQDYPDALAYAYVDHDKGLQFAMLCPAKATDGGKIDTFQTPEFRQVVVSGDMLRDHWVAGVLHEALVTFEDRIDTIRRTQAESMKRYARLRKARALDDFRVPLHPDDIIATLYSRSHKATESARMRLERLYPDGTSYARLIDEPALDLGVHRGDMMPLGFQEIDGKTVCLGLADEAC